MKKYLFSAAILAASLNSYSQNTWEVDAAHSHVGFTVKHMGIANFHGQFTSFESTVTSSKTDFSDLSVSFATSASSVNTANDGRDKHLMSKDFFDTENTDAIVFKSKSVIMKDGKILVTGDLTMHGVTKEQVVEVTPTGSADQKGKKLAGFHVTAMFKRSDFKIGESMPNAVVSDEVHLVADLEYAQSEE